MKIVSLNTLPDGSTGNIMVNIAKCAKKSIDAEVTCFYGNWKNKDKQNAMLRCFGNVFENALSHFIHLVTGYHNIGSWFGTLGLLKKIDKIKPDIIHIHNLHLWVVNVPMLFSYIKKHGIKVVWTFHDCWAFTGQCPHFTMAKCDKWKDGCCSCRQYKEYPKSLVDRTKTMYRLKKRWFTEVKDMVIVTPSQWLADLVKQSFLKDYDVKVINNGIDLSVFKPTESDFRKKHHLEGKYIILGVAAPWTKRKGFDVFAELAKRLDDKFRIVLVGISDEQSRTLPENIIGIKRTSDQKELAEIYSAADVFANPTREDNFPTVNIESLACGTPVVTFNTGGSPEIIDKTCGSVTECDDIDAFERELRRVCEDKPYSEDACVLRSKRYDMNDKFEEYVKLYNSL